jgi:hypothetical protein
MDQRPGTAFRFDAFDWVPEFKRRSEFGLVPNPAWRRGSDPLNLGEIELLAGRFVVATVDVFKYSSFSKIGSSGKCQVSAFSGKVSGFAQTPQFEAIYKDSDQLDAGPCKSNR